MSHIISDELYNEILNTEFPPELLNIKNSIINSNINNNQISKLNILIRTLSKNEYNAFIRNNTLNGAITKYDINSWHYDKCCDSSNTFFVSSDWYGYPANSVDPYIPEELRKLNKQYFPGNGQGSPYYQTYNFGNKNLEIINNNKLSVCNVVIHFSAYVALYAKSQYTGVTCKYFFVDDSNLLIEKNFANKKFTLSSNIIYFHTNNSHSVKFDVLCDANFCFRPVFQYIDNNKSKNIYS